MVAHPLGRVPISDKNGVVLRLPSEWNHYLPPYADNNNEIIKQSGATRLMIPGDEQTYRCLALDLFSDWRICMLPDSLRDIIHIFSKKLYRTAPPSWIQIVFFYSPRLPPIITLHPLF